jgi:hypothetical protein
MAKVVLEVTHTLHDRLQVNDLQAWAHDNDETPITVYKGEHETAAEVLNHGCAEYLLEDDSENEEMCELEHQ